MSDISKIKLPNNDEYNVKDANVPHSSLSAQSGGTTLSLVTTGEKYTWEQSEHWEGTQAQYNALTTIDPNTVYYITDSVSQSFVLDDLTDVQITSLQLSNGQTLVYDQTNGVFVNTHLFREMTQSQYDALAVKDPNTAYFISDSGAVVFSIDDAQDVVINSNTLANGQTLVYRSNIGKFVNGTCNDVTQTATADNTVYEVLFSGTGDNTTRAEGARKNNNLTFNPSTGNLKTTKLNGVDVGNNPKFTDTNDKVQQVVSSDNKGYSVLLSYSDQGIGSTNTVNMSPRLRYNPYSGFMYLTNTSGGVGLDFKSDSTYGTLNVNSISGTSSSAQISLLGSSGNVRCVSVTQTSSRKVKKNIKPMTKRDVKKILELEAVSFDYKNEEQGINRRGFIAEDVADVLPNLVTPETEDTPACLDYVEMIPYLQAIIKQHEERITVLENKLKELGGN